MSFMDEQIESSRREATNGAQLLDERMPGWHRRINLDTLEIASSCNCVCGQLGGFTAVSHKLGDFSKYRKDYGEWAHFVAEHGFLYRPGINDAWKELIQARLDMDALPESAPAEREMVTA